MGTLKFGDSARGDWRAINRVGDMAGATRREAVAMRHQIVEMQGSRHDTFVGLHPFKIYSLPSWLRDTPNWTNTFDAQNPSTIGDCFKFRVRSGLVYGVEATGTDGATDPDDEDYPDVSDIIVGNAEIGFWFWLEVAADGSSSVVRYGNDPADDSWDGYSIAGQAWGPTSDPWTVFPKPDATHIPIGFVVTALLDVPRVRQILRADLLGGSGSSAECPYA